MDHTAEHSWIDRFWDREIIPTLAEYIRIPNKSPAFDPDWAQHGHMDRAVELVRVWVQRHAPSGLTAEIVRLPGRTPLLLLEHPGSRPGQVLIYGHLDKQPEMSGWRAGLGPWQPVLEGERLYGRGGADDGYAVFAALAGLKRLAENGQPHARVSVLIECCEESGSGDLPAYMAALGPRLGNPDLVICLDSGCGNYDQLWLTTSLRGLINGVLAVEVLREGVHSGDASGVVPSSFRIARELLGRIEDAASGGIHLPACHAAIPPDRMEQATAAASVLGEQMRSRFPFVPGAGPVADSGRELILNRTWRPALEIIGAQDLPSIAEAGNVLRPRTALKLSLRLPPTVDPQAAGAALKQALEREPPYGAQVRFTLDQGSAGWNAPKLAPWLERALAAASQSHFGRPFMAMGEGGTIPFMHMLGSRFPQAQFVVTGVLGPGANAHGPNEFLHVPTAKRLTGCLIDLLTAQARAA